MGYFTIGAVLYPVFEDFPVAAAACKIKGAVAEKAAEVFLGYILMAGEKLAFFVSEILVVLRYKPLLSIQPQFLDIVS